MTVTELERPRECDVVTDDGDDEEVVHYTCCYKDRGMCGDTATGDYYSFDAVDGRDCENCIHMLEADLPCGAPFCKARVWFRVHIMRKKD